MRATGWPRARSRHAESWDFILNVMGSYQMTLYREVALFCSSFRNGQRLGWKEANSEPRAPIGKSQHELNEKLCFPDKGREKGETE